MSSVSRTSLLSVAVCVVPKDLVYNQYVRDDLTTPVGWIEKDGHHADYATHESENVYVGDTVDVHVEVHINPCYSWYVTMLAFIPSLNFFDV